MPSDWLPSGCSQRPLCPNWNIISMKKMIFACVLFTAISLKPRTVLDTLKKKKTQNIFEILNDEWMHKQMNERINREYLLVKIFKSSRKSKLLFPWFAYNGHIHHIVVQCESKWPVKCKHFLAFQINHHFPAPFNIVISLHFPAPFSQPFLRTSAEGDLSTF